MPFLRDADADDDEWWRWWWLRVYRAQWKAVITSAIDTQYRGSAAVHQWFLILSRSLFWRSTLPVCFLNDVDETKVFQTQFSFFFLHLLFSIFHLPPLLATSLAWCSAILYRDIAIFACECKRALPCSNNYTVAILTARSPVDETSISNLSHNMELWQYSITTPMTTMQFFILPSFLIHYCCSLLFIFCFGRLPYLF